MIADDLFAGAGGWDLAARDLGIHARGIENMKEARATREAAGLTTIHDDVWTFETDGKAEGEIASPPCPPWSQAGKKTIVGSFKPEVVAAPGYRTTVSRQNAPDSVRVTVAEAGVLQSFPVDHPWQGAKGKQYLQAGNAVPPGMARHSLATAAQLGEPCMCGTDFTCFATTHEGAA